MTEPYAWTVRASDWPPRAEVRPPYSLTRVEVARSCPLRVIFEASGTYEPLMSFDARIGTAMHATLEYFAVTPFRGAAGSLLGAVRQRFEVELNAQRAQAAQRPRERLLPEDPARIEAAVGALIRDITGGGEAAGPGGGGVPGGPARPVATEGVEVERRVATRDRKFAGRVDRAVRDVNGVALYDYKSAFRDDVPERYARQLQMYAEMWFQTTAERPNRAYIVYPLTGRMFPVDVSEAATAATLAESHAAVQPLENGEPAEALARPGDVCRVCSYRPWCAPFWAWAQEPAVTTAFERSVLGFEGPVVSAGRQQDYHVTRIQWHPHSVATLIAPWGSVPHLQHLTPGQKVRVINVRLQGQVTAPRAVWSAWAELHIVTP